MSWPRLIVDPRRCVRRRLPSSGCRRCVDACPSDAIELDRRGPRVDPYSCTLCLNCAGACPTGAFAVEGARWWHGRGDELTLDCFEGGLCFNAVKVEHLLAALKGYKRVRIRVACQACKLRGRGEEVLEEASRLLGDALRVEREPREPPWVRRLALSRALALAKAEAPAGLEVVEEPGVAAADSEVFVVAAEAARERGIKYLRDVPVLPEPRRCTMCGFCAGVCPAGAIEVYEDGVMVVDEAACVSCGACVEGCPEGALKLERRAPRLSRYYRPMRVCPVCGYAYPAEEGECPKCRQLRQLVLEFYGVRG